MHFFSVWFLATTYLVSAASRSLNATAHIPFAIRITPTFGISTSTLPFYMIIMINWRSFIDGLIG